jgi:uncharacterized protein YndB with AHSA1/START domain
VTDPLNLSFQVACPPDRAFTLWTTRISTWWPSDHTVTGRNDLTVVLESGVGGRIFERTPDGDEHDWGEVIIWDPPDRLSYLWHLARDRSDATEVSIRFVPSGDDGTVVEIEHTGWERLGAEADAWRDRNQFGWQSLMPHYLAAASATRSTTTKEDQS